MPQIQGAKINEFFDIVRPIIEFKFEIVLQRANNIFELQTQENIDVLLKVFYSLTFAYHILDKWLYSPCEFGRFLAIVFN